MWIPVFYWALILGVELLLFLSFYLSYKRLSTSDVDVLQVERLRNKSLFLGIFIMLTATAFLVQAVWLWFNKAPDAGFFKQHIVFISLTVCSILIEAGYRLVSLKVEKLKQVSS